MTGSGRGRGSTYAESTKRQILRAVLNQPGRTGGQIAAELGLDRSRVNSFLYGEGKRRFGLVNSNWRWYPGREVAPWFYEKPAVWIDRVNAKPQPQPQRREVPITDSVCAILSQMSVTTATLKIRTMSLTLIELAFTEDEYPQLDERLQAELVMRKKALEAASQEVRVVQKPPSRWFWVVVLVLLAWVLTLLANPPQPGYQTAPSQGGGSDRALPSQ